MAAKPSALDLIELNVQSMYWCGTWQNTSEEPKTVLESKGKTIKFIIYQLERAPTTGKLHFQLYVEFSTRIRKCTLMKLFPQCFWTKRDGTAQHCIAYCSKEDTRVSPPVSFGTPVIEADELPLVKTPKEKRKKVSALQIACTKIRNGEKDLRGIMEESPSVFVRHHSGLSKLAAAFTEKRDWKPEIVAFYGMPESGKSRTARETALELFKPHDIYRYSYLDRTGKEWWDGYMGEHCIIIEEMDGEKFAWQRMLELLDRYDTKVPVKGSSHEFVAKLIIFTSNHAPSTWYPNMLWPALKRRLDRTFKFCLIEDETLATRKLVYEAQLDYDEMHNPDEQGHLEEMLKLNQEKGYAVKSRRHEDFVIQAPITKFCRLSESPDDYFGL